MKAPTVQKILLGFSPSPENILPALKEINRVFGHISKEQIYFLAEYFDRSPAEIFSTASFYEDLRTEPKSDVEIVICMSAPCEMRGASEVLKEVEKFLGMRADKDKNPKLEIRTSSCQGLCNRGPVMIVNGTVYENVKPLAVDDLLRSYFEK